MKTYRERVQALIEQLQACYDEAGILRDYSNGQSMSQPFNVTRQTLCGLWPVLQNLDNALPDAHAAMKTKGKGLCKE